MQARAADFARLLGTSTAGLEFKEIGASPRRAA